MYSERKVDKELTAALSAEDVGVCVDNVDPLIPSACTGMAEAIQAWLILKGCGSMNFAQANLLTVTKGQVKLSKDASRAKVDIMVEGEYLNDGNAKDVKVRIKGPKMDL